MGSMITKINKSTITAFIALGSFTALFLLTLATPDIYYDFVYGAIAISSVMTVYYWRRERKAGAKTSRIPIFVILVIILTMILVCLLLPAL